MNDRELLELAAKAIAQHQATGYSADEIRQKVEATR